MERRESGGFKSFLKRAAFCFCSMLAGVILYHLFLQFVSIQYQTIENTSKGPVVHKSIMRALVPRKMRKLEQREKDLLDRLAVLSKDVANYDVTSRTLLKELIQKDYSQLREPNLDDWTKVNLLRQWAYEHIDWGVSSTLINTDPNVDYFSLPATAVFSTFYRDLGGTSCGGASHALMKLYRIYGIPAYTFGMGDPDVMTHTVTLAKIQYQGRELLSVQDAAFNLTYVDADGDPYDVFEMLKTLKMHRHDLVHIKEDPDRYREVIYTNKSELGPVRETMISDPTTGEMEVRLPSGKVKGRIQIDLATFNEMFGKKIHQFLQEQSLPAESIYLYLYPENIDGGVGHVELTQKAKSIAGSREEDSHLSARDGKERS